MKIIIDIDESAKGTVMQNVALAKGWSDVTDDQAKELLGQEIAKDVVSLASNGQLIRKRNEERAEIAGSLGKVSVSFD